jgi:hypothetical protein
MPVSIRNAITKQFGDGVEYQLSTVVHALAGLIPPAVALRRWNHRAREDAPYTKEERALGVLLGRTAIVRATLRHYPDVVVTERNEQRSIVAFRIDPLKTQAVGRRIGNEAIGRLKGRYRGKISASDVKREAEELGLTESYIKQVIKGTKQGHVDPIYPDSDLTCQDQAACELVEPF